MSSQLHKLLAGALEEAFEMIYFIDKRVNSFSFKYVCKRAVVSDVWMCKEFDSHWFQQKVIQPLQQRYPESQSQTDVNRALDIIEDFITTLKEIPFSSTDEECRIIDNFIDRGACTSVQELYNRIEQLFVDRLCFVLNQLPSVIFEYVSKSPYAELEERSRTALEFQSKFDLLEVRVQRPLSMVVHTNTASFSGLALVMVLLLKMVISKD